jgi:hypothetical protein
MMLKFTYCRNFAHAETREASWDKFAAACMKSTGYASKEESIKRAAIIGGLRKDETTGRAENIHLRTIAMLDYDDLDEGVTLEDIEFALQIGLPDVGFVAYSTFRHTPEAPRFRVAVPLSRPVTGSEYGPIVDAIRDAIDLGDPDDCSYTMNQIMFLPSHRHGVDPWSLRQDGAAWAVPDQVQGGIVYADALGDEDGLDDLAIAVASEPLDISDDQVAILLESYPAEGLDYDDWLRVGMALYHQTEGRGFDQWVSWSEKSSKHDARQMRVKWKSFGGHASPVTMATLIKAVGGLKGEAVQRGAQAVAQTLEDEAASVCDRDSYNAFKRRVQGLNDVQMPPDIRSMLAKIVHEVYANDAKMGLREVKAAFKPVVRRATRDPDHNVEVPDWLVGWVYAEADCLFVNTNVSDYAIKKEAFRAKFDRMPECAAMEMDAATYALTYVQIPTVVRTMYWPGQPETFETEGKQYVNSYHDSGIDPCETLQGDDDGQSVVDLFLQHVRNTIDDPREQGLLLDFMSYVYRRPENRVRWGLLLWGIEGNGKTYFYHLMQLLLGRNARTVTTSMIERPFNDWAVGSRLIGIEEIRISGTNKWRILDQLKPMISNSTIAVEPKGGTSYHAPNFASYLMTTNHQDAVPMSDNDRRYCVIFTRQRRQDDLFDQHGGPDGVAAYFDRLFTETERRVDAIGRYLMERRLSDEFKPHGRAPKTKGVDEMRAANMSDDRIMVEEAIEDYRCAIVGSDVLDVTYLNNAVCIDGKEMPKTRALANVLRDMGYSQVDGRRVKVGQTKHYVWYQLGPNMDSERAKQRVRDWFEKVDDDNDVPF